MFLDMLVSFILIPLVVFSSCSQIASSEISEYSFYKDSFLSNVESRFARSSVSEYLSDQNAPPFEPRKPKGLKFHGLNGIHGAILNENLRDVKFNRLVSVNAPDTVDWSQTAAITRVNAQGEVLFRRNVNFLYNLTH